MEHLYALIYKALDIVQHQAKRKKAASDGAGDGEAAAEEEAHDEFLLLDDVVTEVRLRGARTHAVAATRRSRHPAL